jgi:hypothetical protein
MYIGRSVFETTVWNGHTIKVKDATTKTKLSYGMSIASVVV